MSHIYTSADQLIGRTPLLELTHLEKKYGLKARILAREGSHRPGHDRRRRGQGPAA